MTLLERAQSRLRQEYSAAGKAGLYERLKAFRLTEKGNASLPQRAAEFGMSASALKSAIHRFRARYRRLVREEVAHTVTDEAQLKEEARHLIDVIGS